MGPYNVYKALLQTHTYKPVKFNIDQLLHQQMYMTVTLIWVYHLIFIPYHTFQLMYNISLLETEFSQY